MKEDSELVFGEMMTDRGSEVDKGLSGRKYRREEVSSIGGRTVNYLLHGNASPDPV